MATRGYFYFETTEVPMLCPPKPWCYHSLTPMLLSGIQFIRLVIFMISWSAVFSGKGLKFRPIRSEKALFSSSDWLKFETLSNSSIYLFHSLISQIQAQVLYKLQCTRYAGNEWKKYFSDVLNEHDRKGHIDVMKYGLDVLGTLPWKVNKQVRQYYLTGI